MASPGSSFIVELLQQQGLDTEVIDSFKSNKITKGDIEQGDDWNHDKLMRMNIQAEGDRKKILDIIARLKLTKTKANFKVFQDPLYGPIEMHPLIVKIIDTPQFQRLRDIKQLGGVYHVYPGASHNRYEHSIGVCYLAGVFVESIRDRQPELGITERDVLCVKIAALCHDMGHGPLSHLFQDLFIQKFKKNWRHEDASKELLDHLVKVNNLYGELMKYGLDWEKDYPFICELITGKKSEGSQEKSFLYQIVANDISCVDVDKMDYIARDCHALGITLNFDWKRYMLFSRVIKHEGEYHICPREKEVMSLYGLFNNRNYLFRVAYQHKTKRAVEFMINEALMKANDHIKIPGKNNQQVKLSDAIDDMVAFTKLTDSILYQIKCSSSDDLAESRQILEKVDKRELYSSIGLCLLKPSPPNTPNSGNTDKSLKQANEESEDEEDMPKRPPASTLDLLAEQTQARDFRPSVEGFERGIVDYGTKRYLDLESRKLVEDALIIDLVTFDYGKERDNPIERLFFYRKRAPNTAVLVKGHQRSSMFPSVFQEHECRIYSKNSDAEICRAIRKGFNKFCRTERHCFEIPLGENEEDNAESSSSPEPQ